MSLSTPGTKILVVCGTTASRKSELAAALAGRLDGELICCDSVQIYRGFRIGAAGPDEADLAAVPHHLYYALEPSDPGDAGRYTALADAAIADVAGRGRLPILVGGTGLYLRALLEGLADIPAVPKSVRDDVRARHEADGIDAIWLRLLEVDPTMAHRIQGGPANTQRVLRAVEVFEAGGRRLSELQDEHEPASRYRALALWPQFDRPTLFARIEARIDAMLEAGLVDEVRALLESGVPRDCRPMRALGYRQVAEHLLDGVSADQTRKAIGTGHRKYARRQATWFKSVADVVRLDASEPDLIDRALGLIQNTSSH